MPDPARWGEVAANLMAFEPVVDGELLPALPIERIASGASPAVDVLAGTTTEEQRLFMVPNGIIDAITDDLLGMALAGYGVDAAAARERYAANRPGATPGELLADVSTDWFFRVPSIRLCEAATAGGATAHAYEFAWPSPQFDGR